MSYFVQGVSTLLMGVPAYTAQDVVVDNTHRGKIVSISTQKLVMTHKDGMDHGHQLASDVWITLDGKTCKAADLKARMRIRVTTTDEAKDVAIRIEALDKQAQFVNAHDGKVVTITGDVLLMTTKKGNELAWTLGADPKVTRDGNACRTDDLKYGMKIRVTIASDGRQVVTRIEALDRNDDFEKRN